MLLLYYLYVAGVAVWFSLPASTLARAWAIVAIAVLLFVTLSRPSLHIARDWFPLGLLLIAYREMDWFSATYKARHLEALWLGWDHQFLYSRGFLPLIESMGSALPWLLELSYLLVYAAGAVGLGLLYHAGKRHRADAFVTVFLFGTLLSYAMFPYFPSDPPRVVFPGSDLPHYLTAVRRLNLALVNDYGLHSSVFPSAHVSSVFSAAWGLLCLLPERRGAGLAMLLYACLVAVATVYGRYHYSADAVAGLGVSGVALGLAWGLRQRLRSSV